MDHPINIVDAFSSGPFTGNQAAVCILSEPADERWMQNIAAEMNLAETAFLFEHQAHYHLRWFTPRVEVDLCGHATLAAAHVLWTEGHLAPQETALFHTRSGELSASQRDGMITLNFPAAQSTPAEEPPGLLEALGVSTAIAIRKSFDYLVHIGDASIVRSLDPDYAKLAKFDIRGIIVTARSDSPSYDIISRFFAPAVGINEDPVTGSAHCILAPYWSGILKQNMIRAYQASPRGGELLVELDGDRVRLSGKAITTVRGVVTV